MTIFQLGSGARSGPAWQQKSGPTDHLQGKPINLEVVSIGPPVMSRHAKSTKIRSPVKQKIAENQKIIRFWW